MKIALGVPCELNHDKPNGFLTAFNTISSALSDHNRVIFAPSGGDINLTINQLDTADLANQYNNSIALSKAFAKEVSKINPDRILAFTNMGLFLDGDYIYYTSNMPYRKVLELVKDEYPDTPNFNKLLDYYRFIAEKEKANYKKADKIIVLSRKIEQSLIEDHEINPQKIRYIPRPVPKINILNKQKTESRMRIILMPAEMRVMKGIRYAIETMKIVKKEVPEAVLMICGRINNYEQDHIRQLLNEAKGKANIMPLGFLPKNTLYNYMRNAECAFMPFVFDECPIAVSECIANSLPVVTNEYAGFDREVINEFGICAKYKDTEDYARDLIKILTDKNLNKRKREGCSSVAEKFTFSRFKKEVNDVFN